MPARFAGASAWRMIASFERTHILRKIDGFSLNSGLWQA
jgi:hypothetical protein